MGDLCRLIWTAVVGLFRSRAALQAEVLVLRHQLNVLRRRSPIRRDHGGIVVALVALGSQKGVADERVRKQVRQFCDRNLGSLGHDFTSSWLGLAPMVKMTLPIGSFFGKPN
jgi:hypothetical protein